MTRPSTLSKLPFLVILALCSLLGARAGEAQQTPNVVFVLLDDLGYADFGVYRSVTGPHPTPALEILTPNIDAFAQQGMLFTDYYANSPVCSPTRVGLFTGLYPNRINVRKQLRLGPSVRGIPQELLTMAEFFKSEGYATGHFGKWHIGRNKPAFRSLQQGYDHSVIRADFEHIDPLFEFDDGPPIPQTGHSAELLINHAIDFIETNQGSPFFVNLWLWAPHGPFDPPLDWETQWPDYAQYCANTCGNPSGPECADCAGRYAALVTNADQQIGRLLDSLDTLGLAEDTIVVIASDNGANGKNITELFKNGRFRGIKGQIFEGGIRVPMIVRWTDPTGIPQDTVNASIAMGADFLPTFADILGTDPATLETDGESLKTVLLDNQILSRGAMFWEFKQKEAIPTLPPSGYWNHWAVRDGDWKLTHDRNLGVFQLYDLAVDDTESTDLASQFPVVVSDLVTTFKQWRKGTPRLPYVSTGVNVDVSQEPWVFSNGRVDLQETTLFDFGDGNFTFSAKIKPTAIGSSSSIIAKKNSTWKIVLRPDGRLRLTVFDKTLPSAIATSDPIDVGQWVDIAFTHYGWDGDTNRVRLYVGSNVYEFDDPTAQIDFAASADEPILIGNNEAMNKSFVGKMKFVNIHLAALEQAELGF